jgi:hypothetical protein
LIVESKSSAGNDDFIQQSTIVIQQFLLRFDPFSELTYTRKGAVRADAPHSISDRRDHLVA